MRLRLRLGSVVIATGLALAMPAGARAGTFDVLACDAAPGFANNSWHSSLTHGGMVAFNACPSGDNRMLGLGLRNGYYPSGWTVPTGAASRWGFSVPGGTAVVGIRANAYFEQRHHRWQVGLSNGSQLLVGCPSTSSSTGGACGAHMTAGEYVPLPPSGALYTEVFCARGPCPVGGGSYYGWASMTWIAVTVLDQTAPAIANVRGELWSDRWMNGVRNVTFDASDNTGIKDVRVLLGGRELGRAGRVCDPTVPTCPDWPGASLDIATTNGTADGAHQLAIEVVDRGGNASAASRQVLIDNTAPAAPEGLGVDGGDGWKPRNEFTVRWRNPGQQAAPIAGALYRLCPAPPAAGQCVTGSRSGPALAAMEKLQVANAGHWTLTVWLRDAAGNARPETAAPPVNLRFDSEPPALAFKPPDPEHPVRVAVEATDAPSGIARGEIELRRQGARAWRALPVELDRGGFSGVLPDESLRDGTYELRARAWDAAGNERSTDRLASGEPATVVLPVRIKTSMRVGKRKTRPARRRRGHRTVYLRRPVVDQGRRVRLRGRLTMPGANPLGGVAVEVAARLAVDGTLFQPVATLTTSRSGRFSYLAPPGASRVLRFRYPGTARVRPQTRRVQLRVRSSSSIRPSRRRVVNGEAVTFAGRLRGGFVPAAGKLLELQFFDRGKWRTFRTFRAAPTTGRWSYSYRFDGTRGTRRYRFRVRIPRESGYPFTAGRSRRVAVTVRGL